MTIRLPLLLALSALSCGFAFAQEIPPVILTPSRATVVVGESKTFRAVDAHGVPDNTVRWAAPHHNAQGSGAEATFYYDQPGEYEITARGANGTASAQLKVIAGNELPEGTEKWAVDTLPGCKQSDIKPAVPSAETTNDVFSVESCPGGQVVRALTADGQENWRTGVPQDQKLDPKELSNYRPKSLNASSVCDKLKVGMTREETQSMVRSSSVRLPGTISSNVWILEEATTECRITFSEGRIAKKQKVLGN